MRSVLISTSLSSLICSWLVSRCSQWSPSQQRFPWALKEQITDDRVFFKMPFRPCPSGCGRFLSADDGHDRCLQCLGFQHAEDAFVDDSCACCGRMSMTSLQSHLFFLKGLAPSAATRDLFSGSSREPPAGALGVLYHPPLLPFAAPPPGTSIVPLEPLAQRLEVWLTLPSLFYWIVEAVALTYQSEGEPCPLGVRAHSTRSVTSSHALAHGASFVDICRAACWATPNTFARFYSLRVEPVSSRVLGNRQWAGRTGQCHACCAIPPHPGIRASFSPPVQFPGR